MYASGNQDDKLGAAARLDADIGDRMKYLVILEPASTTGQIYSESNDGVSTSGGIKCPVLACTEIDFGNPHYIFVKRGGSQSKRNQSLYLPYHSVAHIFQYAPEESHPIGFVPAPLSPPGGKE